MLFLVYFYFAAFLFVWLSVGIQALRKSRKNGTWCFHYADDQSFYLFYLTHQILLKALSCIWYLVGQGLLRVKAPWVVRNKVSLTLLSRLSKLKSVKGL